MSQQAIKLNDKNLIKKQPKNLELEFKGIPFSPSAIYVEKFSLIKQMPCFIPELEFGLDEAFYNGAQNVGDNYLNGYPYKTNLSVAVINGSTMTSYCNVRWIPQTSTQPYGYQSRSNVLNNEYFYAYSTVHLATIINQAINACIIGAGINPSLLPHFLRTESGFFQLLIDSSFLLNNIKILFNEELKILFPFDYEQSTVNSDYWEIKFNPINTTELNNSSYLVSQTIKKSARIFPFNSISFSSENLNVQSILKTDNIAFKEIINYSLIIDDPDSVGDSLEYNLGTLNRTLSINTTLNDKFNFYAYFTTFDNYIVRVMLNYKEFCEMMVIFEK